MFHVGVLYSAQEFLEFVNSTPNIGVRFPDHFKVFSVASPTAIIEVSQKCEWVKLNMTGGLEVTDKGRQILNCNQAEIALRVQVGHLIESVLPPWIPLLSRGRLEAEKYLPLDSAQCMREAGLFGDLSDDIINWWDTYSKVSRRSIKDTKLQVGRKGEKMSLQYERDRTRREPRWEAMESNLSGFDILSTVSEDDPTLLRIEVKTSNSTLETATFYVTKNEWQVATTAKQYLFHLWTLQPKPSLIKAEVAQVANHIPTNQCDGEWENVSIPFSPFA